MVDSRSLFYPVSRFNPSPTVSNFIDLAGIFSVKISTAEFGFNMAPANSTAFDQESKTPAKAQSMTPAFKVRRTASKALKTRYQNGGNRQKTWLDFRVASERY